MNELILVIKHENTLSMIKLCYSLNFFKVFYYLFIFLQILHTITALVAALKTLVYKSTM